MALRRDPEDFEGRLRDLEDAVRALQRGPQGSISISGRIRLGNVAIYSETDASGTVTLVAIRVDTHDATPVTLATLT